MNLAKSPLLPLALLLLAAPAAARAEHAVIDLQLIGPQGRQEAAEEQEPPGRGLPRPQLTVKAGDPLVLHFLLTNVYPHGMLKNVGVRYYVVRTGKFDVAPAPSLSDAAAGDVVTSGEATLNFKPKCRIGARLKFRVPQPGIYLVRVETLNTDSDHEHYAAIDLEVK